MSRGATAMAGAYAAGALLAVLFALQWAPIVVETPNHARHTVYLASGRKLQYLVWPPEAADDLASRHVVIHLHGMLSSGDDVLVMLAQATGNVTRLRNRGAVIGLDRPGFGGSDPSADGYPTQVDIARDVVAFAQTLRLKQYGIVGYSAGGPIALAVAAQNPSGLRDLVLVASPWRWEGREDQPTGAISSCVANYWGCGLLWRSLLWVKYKAYAFSLTIGERAVSMSGVQSELVPVVSRSVCRYFQQGAWAAAWEKHTVELPAGATGRLGVRVELPVHIWHGTSDSIVNISHAFNLAEVLPQSRLHVIRGADHFNISRHAIAIFEVGAGLRPN